MLDKEKRVKNKKWVKILLTLLLSVLVINSTFLYITDTYSIVTTNPKKCFSVPNQKYLITEYILNNKHKYDTYIFGSSRVGSINPYLIKNSDAYNMTYGEGIPREHLLIIKLILSNGIHIKNLLIGLDNFSYKVSFENHQLSFVPKSHYLATGESILDFYKFYFFRKTRSHDVKHFKKKYLNMEYESHLYDDIFTAIFNQEKIFPKTQTAYINRKLNTEQKYDLKIPSSDKIIKDKLCFNNTIEDIKEIIKIAKENNINIKIFINPLNKTTYKYVDKNTLNEFKEELSYLTPFYDFTIPNAMSNDENNWLDLSHYNMYVGDQILRRIYDNNTSIKNFGIYVEKREGN